MESVLCFKILQIQDVDIEFEYMDAPPKKTSFPLFIA